MADRRTKKDAPRIDRVDPQGLTDADAGVLEPDARLDGLRITGDAEDARLPSLVLDECVVEGVRLGEAVLDGLRLTDSVLDAVTATSFRATRASLRDVRLEGCRIGAAEWFESDLSRVELVGCRIDYLALTDARIEDLRFVDCTIGDLDLRGATATRVAFDGTTLRDLSVRDARLVHLDLRGADLDRVDDAKHLAGARISSSQLPRFAPLLADALGIAVD